MSMSEPLYNRSNVEFGEVNCRYRGFKKEKIIHYEKQPVLALNFI